MTKRTRDQLIVAGLLVVILAALIWLLKRKKPNARTTLPSPQPEETLPTPQLTIPDLNGLTLPSVVEKPENVSLPCPCNSGCNKQSITINTGAAGISAMANSARAQIVAQGNALLEYLTSLPIYNPAYSLITPDE